MFRKKPLDYVMVQEDFIPDCSYSISKAPCSDYLNSKSIKWSNSPRKDAKKGYRSLYIRMCLRTVDEVLMFSDNNDLSKKVYPYITFTGVSECPNTGEDLVMYLCFNSLVERRNIDVDHSEFSSVMQHTQIQINGVAYHSVYTGGCPVVFVTLYVAPDMKDAFSKFLLGNKGWDDIDSIVRQHTISDPVSSHYLPMWLVTPDKKSEGGVILG